MHRRWQWLLVSLGFVVALASETVAQRPRRIAPRPEVVKLPTKDGVGLTATYYASTLGKDAAPVILLHDHKDTQEMFSSLARRLQSPGEQDKHPSFAVVTVDLRGHGGSVRQTAPTGEVREIDAAKINRQDIAAMAADLDAVRGFLVGKNDAEELNLNKLAFFGVGMGATVAVNWAAQDWAWPPLTVGKQGQDVKALVLISPRWKYRGISMQQALKFQPLTKNVAWMIIYGDQDADSTADARRLHRQLERFHPEPSGPAASSHDLLIVPLPLALEGSQLLSQAGPRVEDQIIAFLAVHAANREVPWIQRRNRIR